MEATHEIRLSSGTIRYRDTVPTHPGANDAPVLVFIHGFMVDGLLWRKVSQQAELVGALRLPRPAARLAQHRHGRRR